MKIIACVLLLFSLTLVPAKGFTTLPMPTQTVKMQGKTLKLTTPYSDKNILKVISATAVILKLRSKAFTYQSGSSGISSLTSISLTSFFCKSITSTLRCEKRCLSLDLVKMVLSGLSRFTSRDNRHPFCPPPLYPDLQPNAEVPHLH